MTSDVESDRKRNENAFSVGFSKMTLTESRVLGVLYLIIKRILIFY